MVLELTAFTFQQESQNLETIKDTFPQRKRKRATGTNQKPRK